MGSPVVPIAKSQGDSGTEGKGPDGALGIPKIAAWLVTSAGLVGCLVALGDVILRSWEDSLGVITPFNDQKEFVWACIYAAGEFLYDWPTIIADYIINHSGSFALCVAALIFMVAILSVVGLVEFVAANRQKAWTHLTLFALLSLLTFVALLFFDAPIHMVSRVLRRGILVPLPYGNETRIEKRANLLQIEIACAHADDAALQKLATCRQIANPPKEGTSVLLTEYSVILAAAWLIAVPILTNRAPPGLWPVRLLTVVFILILSRGLPYFYAKVARTTMLPSVDFPVPGGASQKGYVLSQDQDGFYLYQSDSASYIRIPRPATYGIEV